MGDSRAVTGPGLGRHRLANLVLIGAVGALFATTSVVGIALSGSVYPDSDLYNSFLPNDYINLFLAVPVLVASVVLAMRAGRLGFIGWAGSLLFILYSAIAYLFAVRNVLSMVVNGLTVGLCVVALVVGAWSLNAVWLAPARRVRRQGLYGGVLVAMGLAFLARALVNIAHSVGGDADLPVPEIGVNIADAVVGPLWILGGILLFNTRPTGFVCGLIAYVHGALLFVSLMVFMAIQPLLCNKEFVASDFVAICIMSLVVIVPGVVLTHHLLIHAQAT